MKRDRLSRHLLVAFLLSLGLYIVVFWFIETRRVANSPWTVSFEVNSNRQATITINQQNLGLGPVRIRFTENVTNAPTARTEVIFKNPKPVPRPMPVGQCLFEDLTFLPGTVVLHAGGVDIQMLPRTLTIQSNEIPWHTAGLIEVHPDGTSEVTE